MHGECHALFIKSVGEKRAGLDRLVEDCSGEHDGGSFTGCATDLEDNAGEDTANGIGKDDAANGLPFTPEEIINAVYDLRKFNTIESIVDENGGVS